MHMAVDKRCMPMLVRVRFAGRIAGSMLVLVMGIVNMAVLVNESLVLVLMLMPLG